MAKEALKKITDAESEGKALKLEAIENAKKIILSSEAEIERIKVLKTDEAKDKAKRISDENGGKCRLILDESKDKARLEGEALKKIIDKNSQKTVDGVISLLLS